MKRAYIAAVIISFALLFALPVAAAEREIYHLVRVKVMSMLDISAIASLGFEIQRTQSDGSVDVVIRDWELPVLGGAGFNYDIITRDLASYYEKRLAEEPIPLSRDFPYGSMGGYLVLSEIETLLDDWATLYPNLITPKMSIGTTIEGRDIWAVKISDNASVDEDEPEVFFNSLIHAREPAGMMTVIWYMQNLLEGYGTDPESTHLVNNREIWFVPVHNPDGYEYNRITTPGGGGMWRLNRRNNGDGTYGVDLNRNYGYQWGYDNWGSSPYPGDETYRGTSAFSEPETQAVRDFFLAHSILTCWDTHCHGNMYLCPFGYDNVLPSGGDWPIYQEWLADVSAVNGYDAGPIPIVINYNVNGGSIDWHYGDQGIFGMAPEIGNDTDGFWPATARIQPLAEENQMPIRYWTWVAGSYVALESFNFTDVNGDGLYHPGERVSITLSLRNKGLADTLTDVTATVSCTNPNVSIETGSNNFGTLSSMTSADNAATPLRVKLSGWTPYGEQIVLDVNIAFDGYTINVPISFTCGSPVKVVEHDMETLPGWTVGDTGDNATAGIWVRAEPIGTTYGSDQVQPELDHTDAPGIYCYVTGNSGAGVGDDDVDDGKTTLKTALFDLSNIDDPEISYWRWYADLGGAPNNDIFQVDISDDGGANWDNVENLAYTVNAWTQVSFRVEDHFPPTANMMMRFIAKDQPNDSLCEAAIDDFVIKTYTPGVTITPSAPFALGTTVTLSVDAPNDAGLDFRLACSTLTFPGQQFGDKYLPLRNNYIYRLSQQPNNGYLFNIVGTLDGSGHSDIPYFNIPNHPPYVGLVLFFAVITYEVGGDIISVSEPTPVVVVE